VVVAIIIFMVVVAVVSVIRLRPGGPGPAMRWIPRSTRAGANREYEKHGWQKPFDDQGNRNPDRDAL
jgi:hypothetical protein